MPEYEVNPPKQNKLTITEEFLFDERELVVVPNDSTKNLEEVARKYVGGEIDSLAKELGKNAQLEFKKSKNCSDPVIEGWRLANSDQRLCMISYESQENPLSRNIELFIGGDSTGIEAYMVKQHGNLGVPGGPKVPVYALLLQGNTDVQSQAFLTIWQTGGEELSMKFMKIGDDFIFDRYVGKDPYYVQRFDENMNVDGSDIEFTVEFRTKELENELFTTKVVMSPTTMRLPNRFSSQ